MFENIEESQKDGIHEIKVLTHKKIENMLYRAKVD